MTFPQAILRKQFASHANIWQGIHRNFHVPCNETSGMMHGNFHVHCDETYGMIHGNFHVPWNGTYGKVHGNFDTLLYVSLQATWKFPIYLFSGIAKKYTEISCNSVSVLPKETWKFPYTSIKV